MTQSPYYAPPNGYAQPQPQQAMPQPQYAAPAPQLHQHPGYAQAPAAPVVQAQQHTPQPVAPVPGVPGLGHFVPAATGNGGTGERYDKFTAKDNTNKPLLVRFVSTYTFASTTGTTKGQQVPAVKVDVYDMSTGQFHINCQWTPAKLVEQVAHFAGDGTVYGIELVSVPTKSGNTMVSAQQISDPGTLAMAQNLADQVAARFDQEHAVRQAEAAQQAVAAQAGQQPQPGGYGYPAGYGQPNGGPGPIANIPGQVMAQAQQNWNPAAQLPNQQPAPVQPYAQQSHAAAQQTAPAVQYAAQQFDPSDNGALGSPYPPQQYPAQQPMPQGPPPLQPPAGQPAQNFDAAAVQAAIAGVALQPQFQPPTA